MTTNMVFIGPPGTGKTQKIQESVAAIALKRQPRDILCLSFTRAAAATLAERNGEAHILPKENISTLHSLAFRALRLQKKDVAESKEALADWNARTNLNLSKAAQVANIEDDQPLEAPQGGADLLLSQYNVCRAKLLPWEDMPPAVQNFAAKWEEWKRENNLFDFCDMITYSLRDTESAPGSPAIVFIDEYQDLTILEQKLINHWGRKMEMIVKVGDPEQAIYSFKGVDPDSMPREVKQLPESQVRILEQSYTLPQTIHEVAVNLINKIPDRLPISYKATPEPGRVARMLESSWRQPGKAFIRAIEKALESPPDPLGRQVMIVATCSYMLEPILTELKKAGIPFDNRYRRNHGGWNPLQPGNGVGAVERFLAYMRPDPQTWGEQTRFWSNEDVAYWGSLLHADSALLRGGKKGIAELKGDEEINPETLLSFFQESALGDLWEINPETLKKYMLPTKLNMPIWEFIFKVCKERGPQLLREQPKVTIGTIHSVKGGRAKHVFLIPDLSDRAASEWQLGGAGKSAIIRQMYVGITRASESLTVLGAGSAYSVKVI